MIHTNFDALSCGQVSGMPACPSPIATSRVMAAMRHLGPELGLSPQVMRTLELLLSCLPPNRNHHMVFASNATLALRSGGLSDRSLRRHIGQLVTAGLLRRMDSPNKKRFTCYDPIEQTTLRFGLDLSPLFESFPQLEVRADERRKQAQQLALLKRQLRAASYQLLCREPDHPTALEAMRLSRRKASPEEILSQLARLPKQATSPTTPLETPQVADSGGQNVCHYQSFTKEHKDKEDQPSLEQLLTHCPEIQSYALEPIRTMDQAIRHATNMGPMIGISEDLIHEAKSNLPIWTVTVLIWLIVQCQDQIHRPAAYFKALTLGTRAESFNPMAWLKKLGRTKAADCPRTNNALSIVRGQMATSDWT